MNEQWFLSRSGDEMVGPLGTDDILRAVRERHVDPSARVCRHDGQSRWDAIGSVDPFASAMREAGLMGGTASLAPVSRSAGTSVAPPAAPSMPPGPPEAQRTPTPPGVLMRVETPSGPLVPHVVSPSGAQRPTAGTRRGGTKRIVAIAGAILGVLSVLGVVLVAAGRGRNSRDTRVRQAMVHVVAGQSAGAGFFVAGPDGDAYVVTAYHVIESGDPVRVERMVEVSDKKSFVEAYPSTEIVAADPDADLAVIRLKEVRADKFHVLPLAKAPVKDEKIVAHGFPRSNLGKLESSISQEGKINAITKFKVVDRVTRRHVRSNAIDGIIISAPLEPGFSGGPSVNEGGEVVGVNVLKDLEHSQQNGAVSVEALARLLATLKPSAEPTPPTSAEVKALLARIEREYLKRPTADRMDVREADFVSPDDLPHVLSLSREVTDMFHDQTLDENRLNGRARLGLVFAGLPGAPLETYRSSDVSAKLGACPRQSLSMFSAPFHGSAKPTPTVDCEGYAKRALVWDLTVSVLQWEGAERELDVSSVERVNDESRAFKASVSAKKASTSFFVWVSTDQGKLRLKLFDDAGKPYWISAHASADAGAFRGTWSYRGTRQRISREIALDAQTTETLNVDVGADGGAQVKHRFVRDVYAPANDRFTCTGRNVAEIGIEQNFQGTLKDGVIWLQPTSTKKDGSPVVEAAGSDAARCGALIRQLGYTPDLRGVLKFVGGRLFFYRTDGRDFPEAVELSR